MAKNLEEAIQKAGSPVKLLWESKTPPAVVRRVVQEFTNWRDEQLAWRRTAVLFDQSHHMANLNIKGPAALKLISQLAVNSIAKFPVDMAKQFVAVNDGGYVIGDNILCHLEEDEYQAVGIPTAINWLHYHAATGGHNVRVWRDDNSFAHCRCTCARSSRRMCSGGNAHRSRTRHRDDRPAGRRRVGVRLAPLTTGPWGSEARRDYSAAASAGARLAAVDEPAPDACRAAINASSSLAVSSCGSAAWRRKSSL